MKLLLLNYSMNSISQVFSHQRRIVLELSKRLESIDVVSSETFKDAPIENVEIFSTEWRIGKTYRNIVKFYLVTMPLLIKHRGGTLFSHMTDVQSALIAIPCKLLRIRHILWYAHKSPSKFLKFCYPFIDVLCTSTRGSCPISGKKVILLGQAIDASIARDITRLPNVPPKSWYHVGRIDPSKNIEVIIDSLEALHSKDQEIQLHFYGSPSSSNYEDYYNLLRSKYAQSDWITFHGQIPYSRLAEVSMLHDAFINAFWGSLDKAIVEALVLKRIVVSANPEYLSEFENGISPNTNISHQVQAQISALYTSSLEKVKMDIERKHRLALASHELNGWIMRLLDVIQEPADKR